MSDTPAVELRQVSKTFGNVKAVDNVTLQIDTRVLLQAGSSGLDRLRQRTHEQVTWPEYVAQSTASGRL